MGGYCPVSLKLEGRQAVVVGGREAAAGAAAALADGGARVAVIGPQVVERLEPLVRAGRVEWTGREYAGPADLAGATVVAAASGDPELDARVAADARRVRALVFVASDPARGDLCLPEVVRRGGLTLAVDTGGRIPALARRIREELEAAYGPEHGALLELLVQLECQTAMRLADRARRQALWERLVRPELAALIREGRLAEVEREVGRLLSGA